jgi:hypothetical protein
MGPSSALRDLAPAQPLQLITRNLREEKGDPGQEKADDHAQSTGVDHRINFLVGRLRLGLGRGRCWRGDKIVVGWGILLENRLFWHDGIFLFNG